MKKQLLFLRKNSLETAFIAFIFIIGLIGLPYREIGGLFFEDNTIAEIVGMLICRAVSLAIMCAVIYHLGLGGFKMFGNKRAAFLSAFFALAIALNNAPWIALFEGNARISASFGTVALFFLECLIVGAFEEISFRGVIFPLVLQKFGTDKKGRFVAVALSSAMFGIIHVFNLLSGSPFGAVAMQVGYSFLIGCMLAIVFFRGGGLIVCSLIHAIYNFCGLIVPQLGEASELWNIPTIIITVVLSLVVCVCMAIFLYKADETPVRALLVYPKSEIERG